MNLFLKLEPNEIALLSGTSLGLRIAAELNARRCQDDRQTTFFEIPVVCADSRENLSPSTRKIGDSAHSATKTHAGEVEVSQSYSAEPAPVSPDTVADQSAPDNHDTSGVGPCSPSADAAFFESSPIVKSYVQSGVDVRAVIDDVRAARRELKALMDRLLADQNPVQSAEPDPDLQTAVQKPPPPDLVWTTERPTEPNWYWLETSSGAQFIRELIIENGELVADIPGLPSTYGLKYYTRFAGPVPKPVEGVEPLPDASAAYFYNGGSI